LHLASGKLLAIDSRFTERFSSPKKNPLGKSYFSDGKEPWRQAGLPCCQELAENLSDGHRDVAHILRHMLGLANSEKNWQMLYLWFDPGGAESKIHQEEIDEFINATTTVREKICSVKVSTPENHSACLEKMKQVNAMIYERLCSKFETLDSNYHEATEEISSRLHFHRSKK